MKSNSTRIRPSRPQLIIISAAVLIGATLGCTVFDILLGPLPSADDLTNTDLDVAIAIVQPATAVMASLGVDTVIQWADLATDDGTTVRITAQRRNDLDEDDADPIQIIGDGSVGSGRDAIADGDNDKIVWDINGVRVGNYVIIATIEAPDGTMQQVESMDADRGTTGVITVTTSLPVPTLTFTAPGAADESVTTGNTFDITWTDNGSTNPDALLTLALDPDADHDNGNESILVSNQPLSESDDNGQFTFFFQDENGATLPDGDYRVFARIDDAVNDIVTVEADGMLQLNP